MDVAQTYLQNSCSWTSWCASDSNTNKRKRIRLENGDHAAVKYAETEQAWSGVDELTGDLPAVQLNHLGVEMQQDYNIGDEFLVFDSFNNFKQEIPSPPNTAENHMLRQYSPVENVHHKKYTNTEQPDREYSPRKLPSSASSSPSSCYSPSCNNANDVKQHNDCQVYNKDNSSYCREHVTTPNTVATCPSSPDALDDSFRFQYVLCAATSIAMKINEETLTYLNQGQPYEIKLKKLGDLTQLRGKVFKSIIRVLFHDRRLQYMERQQMSAWQASRPGDKILQLDLPLSYGIFDHFQDPNALNAVQFLWDPTKEVGVYIKVNCISTEFTAKKHGGEKGVPFRIQIETYTHEKNPRSLHMASCQIKVFKLKGADRKHKQDREKIMKKSPIERENYQNSYECTVFTDMCPSGDPLSPCATINSSVTSSPGNPDSDGGLNNGSVLSTFEYDSNFNDNIGADSFSQVSPRDSATSTGADFTKKICAFNLPVSTPLPEIHNWLRFHRFGAYLSSLENYSVSDLLQLSEERLIQLCGLGDGIRLFNAFSNRTAPRHMSPLPSAPQIPPTKLIVYVTTEVNSNYYMPVYLKSLTSAELVNKMAPIFGLNASQIHSAVLHEPQGPYIIITDEVVQDIKDRTYFFGEISNNTNGGLIKIFLKQVFHNK